MGRLHKKRYREISFIDLAKAAHTFPAAWEAVKKYESLVKQGENNPRIWYSEFNGYRVCDSLEILRFLD